jgi:2-dehydropantoate 2-reductase
LLGPSTAVVFLQNGVPWWYAGGGHVEASRESLQFLDPDGEIADKIAFERVIGGVTGSACRLGGLATLKVREMGLYE